MKNVLLSICLLFPFLDGFSQNWQCVQPGVQRYFTGVSLKGIRIDSTVAVGNDVILYPFRSPRGPYMPFWPAVYLDTNGGSWLGKKIIITSDGVNMFDTYWGDTVFINTLAGIGSSWTFYNDTSSRYYLAAVTSVDTMTVLNVLDSVKTITISAYNAQGLNAADKAHNQTIMLSKNHGLARTFSLYVFPFHPPQLQSYAVNQDFLLDRVETNFGNINSFELTDYHHPTFSEIYDFNVGDVFEYSGFSGQYPYWRLDSVKSQTIISPTQTVYSGTSTYSKYYPVPPMPYWSYTHSNKNFPASDPVNLGAHMPEEWYTGSFIGYYIKDSSHCVKSYVYGVFPTYVDWQGRVNTFEPCGEAKVYKAGFGRINYSYCFDPTPNAAGNVSEDLVFSVKNGVPCGSFHPIINAIDEVNENDDINVYPVPASEIVNVFYYGKYTYTLSDLVGKIVASGIANGKAKISVQNLLSGIYTLYILNEASNMRAVRKVLVQH